MDFTQVTSLGPIVLAWATDFLPRLVTALIILVVGYYGASWAARGTRSLLTRANHNDMTMVPIAGNAVRYGILIFVFIAALGQLGVQTTSVLAVLGAAGLAVGLALQGTLSNIAAGIMLLWLRPFRVGDYIEISSVAGTAEEINLFHSRLRTWDGIYKFVPNSQLWNTTLTNYSRNRTRLILIEFGIAYEDDIATGRKVLADLARRPPRRARRPAGGGGAAVAGRQFGGVADARLVDHHPVLGYTLGPYRRRQEGARGRRHHHPLPAARGALGFRFAAPALAVPGRLSPASRKSIVRFPAAPPAAGRAAGNLSTAFLRLSSGRNPPVTCGA